MAWRDLNENEKQSVIADAIIGVAAVVIMALGLFVAYAVL